ncbi:MAG: immunoglobulin-like domain-containing protein [Roseiarcus sp.]
MQDIANITSTFQQNLIAWLGSAENGIQDFYATVIHASTGNFSNELCVGSTCVTPAQFQAMVAAANQSSTAASPSTTGTPDSTSSPQAPVIAINGANPAVIQVGAIYNDLGATITGPQADLNLGIKTFVNGLFASNIVLDTAQPATDTIDYVVTDSQGLTSTSTRTVIVAPATIAATSSPAQ